MYRSKYILIVLILKYWLYGFDTVASFLPYFLALEE